MTTSGRFGTAGPAVRVGIAAVSSFLASGCEAGGQPASQSKAAESSSVVADTAEAVAGRKLEILTRDGSCALRIDAGTAAAREIPLVPKAPCHFLRSSGGASPRVRQYLDVKTEAVLIVSGTPASDASRATWKLEPGLVCGEESQGVLVRGGKVLVTRAVRKGGITCRDKGVDEKEYWAFAHDEK